MPQVFIDSRLTCLNLSQSATLRVQRNQYNELIQSDTIPLHCSYRTAHRTTPTPHIATMSSQRPDKVVHQDYIAKIRYSNQLPPPPNPPKLLDIPGGGLAEGKYTQAQYAASLARAQPLNIEADAELGMPLDLIGIPGVFQGDERGKPGLR